MFARTKLRSCGRSRSDAGPGEAFGELAFVRNALIAFVLIDNKFLPRLAEKGHSGRGTWRRDNDAGGIRRRGVD